MKTELISIVVPCFNEEESIPLFYAALEKEREFLVNADIEYIFVNDGSNDNTLNVLRSLAKEDKERVKFISFSRNFGKEAGLYAGLQQATEDYVAVMDVDLAGGCWSR